MKNALAHGIGAAIEPQAVHLLVRAVATDAVIAEDRLHVALEIDLGRKLSGRHDRYRGHSEERSQSQLHARILIERRMAPQACSEQSQLQLGRV